MKYIHQPRLKSLRVLFTTIFVCQSRINFSALARHWAFEAKTFRRNFRREFDFIELNETLINQSKFRIEAFAMDASFIKKSGQETFGLDKFWHGWAGKAEKGLEASIISLVDVQANVSLVLTVDQTEPQWANTETAVQKKTRTDFYAEQLERPAETRLRDTRIGVFDGFYGRQKFVEKTVELGFTMISRLRQDANLKHLYVGEQKAKGRKRKFAEKVDFSDLSKFTAEVFKAAAKQLKLSGAKVWSVSLKRAIKLVAVQFKKKSVNLFATDLSPGASQIFRFYRSRFSIEFLMRDARQSGG